MTRQLKFYFAFNSPYAFLANTRIENELAPLDVEIVGKPVYSPRTGPPPTEDPTPKFRYIIQDVRRFADAYGLALNPGPFADTRNACLGYLEAERQGRALPYRRAVYAARWMEGQDIGDDRVLRDAASKAGLEVAEFGCALEEKRHEAGLEKLRSEREADGVFGVPTFVHEGELFWGNDRIEWLVRRLDPDTRA